jgi:hypothetical protein
MTSSDSEGLQAASENKRAPSLRPLTAGERRQIEDLDLKQAKISSAGGIPGGFRRVRSVSVPLLAKQGCWSEL